MHALIFADSVLFLSTLSLRRATKARPKLPKQIRISIHALLAESDGRITSNGTKKLNFYPRSPCGERHPSLSDTAQHTYFYPRSPCGERLTPNLRVSIILYFYPRSPCGERRIDWYATGGIMKFLSTLSLRRATLQIFVISITLTFLSTLSLRRATVRRRGSGQPGGISIHALLAESDRRAGASTGHNLHFYPRSPCGERR